MKRNLNLLALILVFCIVAVGLEGCGMSKEEKILKHLEEKYGETFVVDEFIGAGWDVHYNEFHCHSDSHPDERFAVFENSDGTISDDYFGVLAKPKYEEMLRCQLDKYFNDYKLFFNFTQRAFNDRFTDSNKLESYIKSAPRIFDTNITVFTNNEDIDDTEFETICNDLQKQFVCFTISIEVFDEQEYLEANEEDMVWHIDEWARLFEAKTWEDIKMLAENNEVYASAASSIYYQNTDSLVREKCQAREEAIRHEEYVKRKMRELEEAREEAIRHEEYTKRKMHELKTELEEAREEARKREAEKDAEIESLKKQLKEAQQNMTNES